MSQFKEVTNGPVIPGTAPSAPSSNTVTSVAGRTGAVVLTKADIGLSLVDNTADTAKPVSTAQQTADAAVSSAAAAALATHTSNTSNPHSVTKAQVGLGNVPNTDATARANHTGTQLASTISDFTAAVEAAAPGGTSTRKTITQAAHGFSAKQAVYDNAGTWALAKADAIGTARVVAVIESVTTDTFVAVFGGELTVTGWAANTQYYLSDATAGLLTATQPTAAGSFIVPVARSSTTTRAYVEIGDPLSLALIPLNALATDPLARANHTGTQDADTITDGTTNKAYTATEKTKLAGIAAGAQVNRNISSQAAAEAGTDNDTDMTPVRVAQAIAALAAGANEPVGMAKLWPASMSGSIPAGYSETGVFGIPAMTSPDADYIGIVKVGTQVATPTFSPAAGSYGSTQSVTISCATSGVTIKYTTDGSTPSRSAGTVYSAAVSVAATATLKAIAYKDFYPDSAVASGTFTITVAPTLSARTINSAGTSLTLTGSEALSVGAGGSAGFTVNASGGAVTATYASGAGTSALVYTLSRTILSTETVTLDYTQPGNGLEATTGGADLASFSAAAVTNNSTQTGGSNNTVDIWQTFEFATVDATTLAANDHRSGGTPSAAWLVYHAPTTSAAAQLTPLSTINTNADSGALGLVIDNDIGDAIRLDLGVGPVPDTQIAGVWVKARPTSGGYVPIYSVGETSGEGSSICFVRCTNTAGVTAFTLHGATVSPGVTVTSDAKYFISLKFTKDGTCYMRVYDASGSQVGVDQSVAASAGFIAYYHNLGGAGSVAVTSHFDNWIVNHSSTASMFVP